MGFEEISEQVLSEARKEAERMIESARKKTASRLSERKEELGRELRSAYEKKTAAIAEDFGRRLALARDAAGKQVLQRRNALIRSIFDQARCEVLAWPEDRYAEVMSRLLEQASGEEGGRIVVHPDDSGVFARVVSGINWGRPPGARITIDGSARLTGRGGFVFRGQGFETDLTLDALLKDIEREVLPGAAAELFY